MLRKESAGAVPCGNGYEVIAINRREVFHSIINHREAGGVLADLGKRSFHKFIYNRFRKQVGLPPIEPKIIDKMSQCVVPDEDLLELLDIDFRWLFPAWTEIAVIDEHSYRSPFGVLFKANDAASYFAVADAPMAAMQNLQDIGNYAFWPDTTVVSPYEGLMEQAVCLEKNSDYVIGLDGIRGGILQTAIELRGFDSFFIDLALRKDYICTLLDKVLEVYQGYYTTYLNLVGKYGQVIFIQDDFGTQNSMLMSPEMWREMVMPREAALIRHIKKLAPQIKVIFHSDGCIAPIIADMAEMGVDILNPVQTSLDDFSDTYALKEEYGDRICFHGGIDVQKFLVEAEPDEVRLEVNRRICDLGRGGGYVITTCHNINADIPVRNLKAMYDAIKEFKRYPLKRLNWCKEGIDM